MSEPTLSTQDTTPLADPPELITPPTEPTVTPVEKAPEAPSASAPTSNFTQTSPYSAPAADYDTANETVFLPSGTIANTRTALKDVPQITLGNDPKSQEWMSTLNGGLASLVYAGGMQSTVEREGASFEQSVKGPVGNLAGNSPRFTVKEGEKYVGERARLRIRSALNLGTVFHVPLWHSGFWLALKSPSEGNLLELYRKIDAEKVSLGRTTYGLMFSNGTSYTTRLLLDFVVDHIYESTFSLKDGDDIRNYIRIPDLPLLIWGMACATWPNGFQYQRSCIADPEKCKHVIQEKLNLSKLLWTDTTALTERQVKHMSNRQRHTVDAESVKRYVDEFIVGQDRKVEISDQLSVILRIPTAVEHIDAGYRWINTIEENYGRSMSQSEETRDEYLLKQGKATTMRQYAHLVQGIEVNGVLYDEQEVIEDTLNDLTADDTIRNTFMEKAMRYLDDSVVSLIAIPTYKCPSCGKEQPSKKDGTRFPSLLPMDVNQTFFTLLVQRLRKIEAR